MLVGALLMACGIIGLIFPAGIRYMARERLPHGADTQVISKQEKIVSIPTAASGLLIVGGLLLMVVAARK
jgi:hypothetical protein